MANKRRYPKYILEYLRQRRGMCFDNPHADSDFQAMPPNEVFREVLQWNGLLGGWDEQIKGWIRSIYGIDLDEINHQGGRK